MITSPTVQVGFLFPQSAEPTGEVAATKGFKTVETTAITKPWEARRTRGGLWVDGSANLCVGTSMRLKLLK